MAKDRNGCLSKVNGEEEAEEKENEKEEEEAPSRRSHGRKSKRKKEDETNDEDYLGAHEGDKKHSRTKKTRGSKRKSRRRDSDEDSSSSSAYSSDSEESDSDSDSESESSDYSSEVSKSEDERRRRKRRERRKRKEREYEKERRRRKREREKEKERKRRKKEKERKKKKKRKEKDGAKKGAVTNSWGKYGIIHETDMWNKRPEFTAWLAEVKQVNLETLPNREEKEMFKQFMEDHNTATFPSKKYYNLDAYHRRKIEKEIKKGPMKALERERTVFNDEEQRRLELLQEREKHKEEQVEALKRSMQSGMAQAMKEQAQLKEEMAFQYKLGNFEAAAAIQRRLDPDIAM